MRRRPRGITPASRRDTPIQIKRATALRVTDPPVIDGLLDERAWEAAMPIGDFVQAEPTEGGPASEQTDVRLVFDNKTLYVGVVCFDSDPSKIVSADSRRDSSLVGQDSFQLIFDTYHDRQNGFIFGTTPVGLQYDAQVRNEGETLRGGPPSGVGGGGNTGGRRRRERQLGRFMGGQDACHRDRMDGRICDPAAHASLWSRAAALGSEFRALD